MRVRNRIISGACALVAGVVAIPAMPALARVAPPPGAVRTSHLPARPIPVTLPTVAGLAPWRADVRLRAEPSQQTENPVGYTFNDVEAVGQHDAWAVGESGRYSRYWARPVVWQWHNGRWNAARVPRWLDGSRVGGWVNQMQAVGGSSPSDVWAVGVYYLVTQQVVRAVHWDGRHWTKSTLPSTPTFAPLQVNSVLSFGTQGAWAFGCYCDLRYSPVFTMPYIARFYRGAWHDVTPPGLASGSGSIWTASAISASDIWAIMTDPNTGASTLLHWNGRIWRTLSVPVFGTTAKPVQFAASGGIVTAKNGSVWLSGSASSGGNAVGAIAYERNGRWDLTQLAAQGQLTALVPDGRGGMWSALRFGGPSDQIWHFAGGHWQRAANPAGVTGSYFITWMAHVPGTATSLAIGADTKHELLFHG